MVSIIMNYIRACEKKQTKASSQRKLLILGCPRGNCSRSCSSPRMVSWLTCDVEPVTSGSEFASKCRANPHNVCCIKTGQCDPVCIKISIQEIAVRLRILLWTIRNCSSSSVSPGRLYVEAIEGEHKERWVMVIAMDETWRMACLVFCPQKNQTTRSYNIH